MQFRFRISALCPAVLAASAVAIGCGASTGTPLGSGDAGPGGSPDAGPSNNNPDGGSSNNADGGGTANCATTTPAHHHSYVPCDLKPTSAARLIVMGDSISYGYGTTQPGSSTCANDPCDTALAYYNLLINNDDTQWPTETNTTLPALFNVSASSIPVVNVAYPGDTTSNIATNQLTATTANPSVGLKGMFPTPPSGPSIVVITIAGNDMLAQVQNMSSSSLDSAINTMISNIETAVEYLQDPTNFPDGVYIYLANLYDPSDATGVLPYSCLGFGSVPGSITNATLEAGLTTLFNDEVQLAQQLNFAVIDDLGHFHGHGLYAANQTATSSAPADPNYDSSDPTDWFYTDCIHPTNAGHNELRRLFFEAISGTYIATDI